MKKGLKFWSKLLIASFFLGGMVTSAMAQNGTTKANCAGKLGKTYTRTELQMTNGTIIPIKFDVTNNSGLVGDKYYVVAATNGSLLNVECNNQIGANLEFEGTASSSNDETATVTTYNNDLVPGELNHVGVIGSDGMVYLKVKNTASTVQGTYLLGIFIKDDSDGNGGGGTTCFSDVYWVEIKVVVPIYAALTLNKNTNDEYICSSIDGGAQLTTRTNIGFTLCNVPQEGGKLYYTVEPTFTSLTGVAMNQTGTAATTIPQLTNGTETTTYVNVTAFDAETTDKYTLKMGAQTLTNTLADVASTVAFKFKEGVTKFYYEYTNSEGVLVNLPIIFQTPTQYCGGEAPAGDALDSVFTVHVAPNFGITTKLYANEERTSEQTLPFCQGTMAYLGTTTTATEGDITDWVWVVDAGSANATEARAKFSPAFSTTDPIQAAITSATGLVERTALVGLLTDITENVYNYDLTATWNDSGRNYTGCTAKTDINIAVKAAPILLLATDQAIVDGAFSGDYNVTDQITAPKVCPGNPIDINTNETADFAGDAQRVDYMNAGNYIRANSATLSYTIDPLGNDNLKAYTDWRSTPAANGTLNVTNHYLNNSSADQANITYTIQNAGTGTNTCALVKSNGMPLTNGKVQVIYPVEPRPQFQLGAN